MSAFIVSPACINDATAALAEPGEDRSVLGRSLYHLNLDAVAGRYAHNREMVKACKALRPAADAFAAMEPRCARQRHASLSCLLYQCWEDATIGAPLTLRMKARAEAMGPAPDAWSEGLSWGR